MPGFKRKSSQHGLHSRCSNNSVRLQTMGSAPSWQQMMYLGFRWSPPVLLLLQAVNSLYHNVGRYPIGLNWGILCRWSWTGSGWTSHPSQAVLSSMWVIFCTGAHHV